MQLVATVSSVLDRIVACTIHGSVSVGSHIADALSLSCGLNGDVNGLRWFKLSCKHSSAMKSKPDIMTDVSDGLSLRMSVSGVYSIHAFHAISPFIQR